MRWLDSIADSMDMSLSKCRETVKNREPGVLQFMWFQEVRQDLKTTKFPSYFHPLFISLDPNL